MSMSLFERLNQSYADFKSSYLIISSIIFGLKTRVIVYFCQAWRSIRVYVAKL